MKSLLFSMKKDVRTADAPSALNLQISGELAALLRVCSPVSLGPGSAGAVSASGRACAGPAH